ncbi:two-component regulator propeller domain-containing protein [Spirosoma knui]
MVALSAQAQETEFNVVRYDESRGLSSRYVRCMLQDRQGFMWFGTPDGLNRFDGHTFVTFRKNPLDSNSVAGNYINRLAEDQEGNIWIGLYTGGVSCYNPRRGRFTHYPLRNVAGHNFQGIEVTALYADQQNQIWLGIKGEGMVHLDPKTGQTRHYNIVTLTGDGATQAFQKLYNILYRIYETPTGLFYLITHDGLYTFDRRSCRMQALHNPAARLRPNMHDDVFGPYAVDGDLLWLGSWAGGLSSYNTKTGEWKNFKFDKRILPTTNIITGIGLRGKDTLWLTSPNRGFGYFHKPTATFTFIADKTKFPFPAYYELLIDKAGTFWMNAEEGLLSAWQRVKPFAYVPVPVKYSDHFIGHIVNNVFENDQYRLIGTWWADGLQVYNKRTGKQKNLPVDISLGEQLQLIMDIQADSQGNIWIVSRDYLYRFDPVTETLVRIKQPPIWSAQQPTNSFRRIQEDRQHTYWLATNHNGVFRYDPKREQYTHYAPTTNRPLGTRYIRGIDIDRQGRIWVGGREGYLAFFDSAQGRFRAVPLAYNGTNPTRVTSLLVDRKGFLYVGTDIGLLVYDARQANPTALRLYTAQDGLKGDIVHHMSLDEFGKIWCITETTLCALNPQNHRIDSYGLQDGITYSNIGNTLSPLPGGYMALATNAGYYRFRPASLRPLKQEKIPVITSFRVYDRDYYYQKELNRNGFIRLEPDENSCSFEFTILDYKDPDAYQYVYKLDGMDTDWVRAERRRYASYTNLPGGNYVFRVKALNRTGDMNVPELAIPIYVETIFYATWWFRIGLVLLFVGSVYAYYRNQIRNNSRIYQLQTKANALEKEKALVMYESLKQQLNPHFLFNSLTSLSSLIRIDQKLAIQFLDSLSKMYRYILKNRDTELVPLEDELRYVQMYINLQKTRFEEGLQIHISVDEDMYSHRIVPVTLQNLLENAIKHNVITTDTPLRISIYTEGECLIVLNNLQKKKFVQTSNRQGLANLTSFYQYLSDKSVDIQESADSFTVKIPLL